MTALSAGLYDVVLRDNCGPTTAVTTSASVALTVVGQPSITDQPGPNRTVCESANDTLRIRSTGAGRTFQWRQNGVPIAGATDSNYVIGNMGVSKEGSYDCIVSGLCPPSVTSAPCSVIAAIRPRVTAQPSDLDVCPGSSGSLSVAASGTNLVYQWFKDGVAVPNGFNSTLTFTNYNYASNGQYYCVITSNIPNPNFCLISTQTKYVRVTGFRTPVITAQPKSVDVCTGSQLSLTVEATGSGLAYQWFRNGVPVPNSDRHELAINTVTSDAAGSYTVRITGTCDLNVTSTVAKVVVISKPTFTQSPLAATLVVGDRLYLSVAATDWRTIQWTKNDQPIPGATSTTYIIERVGKGDAGYYNAIVRNTCSGASSSYAKVVVNDPTVPTPMLELSQSSVDFGEIPVGYDKSLTLSGLIKNVGTAPLIVSGMSASPNEFSISNGPTLPLTLAPGATAGVTLMAIPTARGPLNGSLSIRSNSPSNPTASVPLSASYVLRYDHPATQEFGSVLTDATLDRCISITNTSAVNITVEQATLTGVNSGQFSVVTTLPLSIAAGQSADLCVKFTPGTAGSKTATLNIRSSNGGNSSIAMSGVGETPAGIVDANEVGISSWPNPTTDHVDVRFAQATPSMTISIIGTTGRMVTSFSNEGVDAGGTIRWNGRDASGASVASGSYIMVIRYGGNAVSLPISIIR
ncbi:MAG: immunoglobulin domain-containing protein [Candidatus Kapabacteria bacterium]|nr:immunoglobulin domain-containing protein [Candidatus Kapabacteria bacterium]